MIYENVVQFTHVIFKTHENLFNLVNMKRAYKFLNKELIVITKNRNIRTTTRFG